MDSEVMETFCVFVQIRYWYDNKQIWLQNHKQCNKHKWSQTIPLRLSHAGKIRRYTPCPEKGTDSFLAVTLTKLGNLSLFLA